MRAYHGDTFMLNRLKYGIKIKNPVLDEIKESVISAAMNSILTK